MKSIKIFVLFMALGIFAACGNSEPQVDRTASIQNETPVTQNNGNNSQNENENAENTENNTPVTAPDRIFVLDHSALDIVQALGLGSNVVGVVGGRSASDASYLQDFYSDDRIAVLDIRGGGGTPNNAGGGVFGSTDLVIENSTIAGNMLGETENNIANVGANFDGGGNHFGAVTGLEFEQADTTEINIPENLANGDFIHLSQEYGEPPVFVPDENANGAETWVDFVAAVEAARPGGIVGIAADLTATSVLTIDKDIQIEGNGFTVSKGNAIVGAMIVIPGEDTAVAIINIVFDGQNFSEPHESTDFDGGIIRNNATLAVINTLFKNGFARMITGGVGRGGAINNTGKLIVAGSYFYNNHGSRSGGAIWSSGELSVRESVFVGNKEDRTGGGAISASGTTNITKSVFYKNQSILGSNSNGSQGGAIWASGNTLIKDSTIIGNHIGVMPEDSGDASANDIYFTIDADLIIGGAGQAAIYDDVLSIIAPTVLIGNPREHENGVFSGVIEATRTIAPIFGMEAEAEEIIYELQARYNALVPVVSEKSGIFVTLNPQNGGFVLAPETLIQQSLLTSMGFTQFDRNAVPEHFQNANAMRNYAEANELETQDVMQMFLQWVDEQEIEYVIVFDNRFTSLDEAEADNADFSAVRTLTAYQENRFAFQRNSAGTFGLTRMNLQLEDLENLFS